MDDYYKTRLYLTSAFIAGILLTLGFKDFYPDLERRFRQGRRRRAADVAARLAAKAADSGSSGSDAIENNNNNNNNKKKDIILDDHTICAGGGGGDRTICAGGGGGGGSSGSTSSRWDDDDDNDDNKEELVEHDVPDGIEACVGNTPLFRIKSLSEETGCEIFAKAEFMNGAGGSPKDRVALSIIKSAEEQGLLRPYSGDTIYEGTVGSTGISLATVCRAKGYLTHICMPSDQATEKSELLLKLGAIVERVPPASIVDSNHFVNRAKTLAAEHTADPERQGRGYFANQFENEANWQTHYESTGPEIFGQCGGKIDSFVTGAGTGGTITGVARFLKEKLPNIKIVLADPQGSGLFNRIRFGVMFDPKEKEGTRRRQQVDTIVEGIGINRVTANFEAGRERVDDAIKVTDDQALAMARWLAEKDGIFIGSSSAVNCVAAVKLAHHMDPGSRIVTILCDSGTRHLSKFWKKVGDIGGKTATSLMDVLGYPEVLIDDSVRITNH